jgi:hypothetical protein
LSNGIYKLIQYNASITKQVFTVQAIILNQVSPLQLSRINSLDPRERVRKEKPHASLAQSYTQHHDPTTSLQVPNSILPRSPARSHTAGQEDRSVHRSRRGQKCIGRESNPGLAESSEILDLVWQRPILPLNHQCYWTRIYPYVCICCSASRARKAGETGSDMRVIS